MAETLEFSTTVIHDHPSGREIETALLETPVAEIDATTTGLTIDGEQLATPPQLVTAIAGAIKGVRKHEAAGSFVDCTTFATLTAGGSYRGVSPQRYTLIH